MSKKYSFWSEPAMYQAILFDNHLPPNYYTHKLGRCFVAMIVVFFMVCIPVAGITWIAPPFDHILEGTLNFLFYGQYYVSPDTMSREASAFITGIILALPISIAVAVHLYRHDPGTKLDVPMEIRTKFLNEVRETGDLWVPANRDVLDGKISWGEQRLRVLLHNNYRALVIAEGLVEDQKEYGYPSVSMLDKLAMEMLTKGYLWVPSSEDLENGLVSPEEYHFRHSAYKKFNQIKSPFKLVTTNDLSPKEIAAIKENVSEATPENNPPIMPPEPKPIPPETKELR